MKRLANPQELSPGRPFVYRVGLALIFPLVGAGIPTLIYRSAMLGIAETAGVFGVGFLVCLALAAVCSLLAWGITGKSSEAGSVGWIVGVVVAVFVMIQAAGQDQRFNSAAPNRSGSTLWHSY